jgi:hypothetical protein
MHQHSKLVFVQNDPLFECDNDQQSTQGQFGETTLDEVSNEVKIFHEYVQLSLSKSIIRPWEEIQNYRERT